MGVFHIMASDDNEVIFTACDGQKRVVVIKPDVETKVPHGKLTPGKSYQMKNYKTENDKILLTKNTSVSVYPTSFPQKILSEFSKESDRLLKTFGSPSILALKSSTKDETVSMRGKIVKMGRISKTVIKTNKQQTSLRHARIADKSGTIRVALFGEHAHNVQKDKTYLLSNVQTQVFLGRRSVVAYQSSKITETTPLSDVKMDMSDDEEDETNSSFQRTLTGKK